MDNFRGERTDISAEKEALVVTAEVQDIHPHTRILPPYLFECSLVDSEDTCSLVVIVFKSLKSLCCLSCTRPSANYLRGNLVHEAWNLVELVKKLWNYKQR